MAVAVGRHKREVRTGLRMNFLFFLMSVVVLIVMGISMFKDTHPEWLAYQLKFSQIERGILIQKKAELQQQISHPTYQEDYDKAKKAYLNVKAKVDVASAELETTEADLEEMEVRLNAGNSEEGGSPEAAASPAPAKPGAAPVKPTKNELDDLDKEFSGNAGKGAAPVPEPKSTQAKPAAKASDKELADLDKEFGDSGTKTTKPSTSKPAGKPNDADLAELDKEFKDTPAKTSATQPTVPSKTPTSAKGANSELDELDKEFKDVAKPAVSTAKGVATTAVSASSSSAYEEADFKPDIDGAKSRLEAADRDLLIAQRVHTKEVIGLPEGEALRHQVSDAHLKDAKQTENVAKLNVDLEVSKANVKKAAEVAKWAADVKTLAELTSKNQVNATGADELKRLRQSSASLQSHVEDLQRDLRLIEGRLTRNLNGAPEVEQTFVDRLGAIDRCTTCHRAVEQTGFETTAEPFRTHSPELLKYHPSERFGCVSCHGGWGNALTKNEAHGGIIGKGKPLLVGDQVQSSCGKCHGETRQLSGEATYLAGAKLFKNSGCLGCHKVESLQSLGSLGQNVKEIQSAMPKAGPDLDRVSEKLQPTWLVGWLRNPQSHSLDARMPNLGLAKDQAMSIASFLLTQKGASDSAALPNTAIPNAQRLALGKRLTVNLGCLGCHTIRGEGASFAPELTNIRTKVNSDWLYGWIANPKAYFPNSKMPVFNLSKDQCMLIGDYLMSVGEKEAQKIDIMPNLRDRDARDRGAQLIAERGCAACHDIKGFEKISAPELTSIGDKSADILEFGNAKTVKKDLYDYIVTKITDPRSFDSEKFKGKMPKFGLEKDDAKTIAVYLMSLSSQELAPEYTKDLREQGTSLLAGRKIFEQHDCFACHRIAGQGGKVGPELTREGEMVRPGWLFEFLKQPARIRWWQDARMPHYHLSDKEATTLTEYLMALANQPAPYEYTPPDQKVFPLAQSGAKYFEDLKCQSCHPLAGKQGVSGGAATKKLGPDLGLVPVRLKKDWLLRFLRDPQAFSPGTQMPNFQKPDEQYAAIIDFLMKQQK